MELSILDRLLLLNVMPAEGDITTIRIVRELREALSFTENEIADNKIAVGERGNTNWEQIDAPKDVDIGAKAHEIIVKALRDMSEAGKVTGQHLPIFDKFGIED